MEPVVPVVDCQLDVDAMGIRDRVCLVPVYLRIEGLVAHGQGGEVRRCARFAERASSVSSLFYRFRIGLTNMLLNDPRLLPSSYVCAVSSELADICLS